MEHVLLAVQCAGIWHSCPSFLSVLRKQTINSEFAVNKMSVAMICDDKEMYVDL